MLSLGLPLPLCEGQGDPLVYVALALPMGWDATVSAVHAVLAREGGQTAAASHPPHITLHPPFRLNVPRDALSEALQTVSSMLPDGEVEIGTVDAFRDDEGSIEQIVLRLNGGFCEQVHAMLLDALAFAWDNNDTQMFTIWPERHRRAGFIPHVSLAIGDLTASSAGRDAQLTRVRGLMADLEAVVAEPRAFVPDRLLAIAYESRLDGSLPTAGPAVLASAALGGAT